MFYVLYVSGNGVPQNMKGPMNWEDACSRSERMATEYIDQYEKVDDGCFTSINDFAGVYVIQVDND